MRHIPVVCVVHRRHVMRAAGIVDCIVCTRAIIVRRARVMKAGIVEAGIMGCAKFVTGIMSPARIMSGVHAVGSISLMTRMCA